MRFIVYGSLFMVIEGPDEEGIATSAYGDIEVREYKEDYTDVVRGYYFQYDTLCAIIIPKKALNREVMKWRLN